jgi:hypothetical protein
MSAFAGPALGGNPADFFYRQRRSALLLQQSKDIRNPAGWANRGLAGPIVGWLVDAGLVVAANVNANYTRIGISTYSALASPASCTTVGAEPSEKRNSTCSGIWSVMSLR